jgi:hypothetical protein
VARVRWELSNLLASLMIEADPKPAAEAPPGAPDTGGRAERASGTSGTSTDYPLKAGVLNECITWAGTLS